MDALGSIWDREERTTDEQPRTLEAEIEGAIPISMFLGQYSKEVRRRARRQARIGLKPSTREAAQKLMAQMDNSRVRLETKKKIVKKGKALSEISDKTTLPGRDVRRAEDRKDRREARTRYRKEHGRHTLIGAATLGLVLLVGNVSGVIGGEGSENQASALGSAEKPSRPSDNKKDDVPPVEHGDEGTPARAPKPKAVSKKDITIDGAFKEGSSGPTAFKIEGLLNRIGCEIDETRWVLGSTDVASVEVFQGNVGLERDRIAGKDTRRALAAAAKAGNVACGA